MIISQIVAMSENKVIGKGNHLPWNIPEDMHYFQEKTKGHCIVMGRKTFNSISNKPLKDRLNVVVTQQKDLKFPYAEVCVVPSIQDAIALCQKQIDQKLWPEEIFICGGSQIYEQTMDIADRIYLTLIDEVYEGDTFFPDFDKKAFELISACPSTHSPEITPSFTFLIYERNSNQKHIT